MNSLLTVRDTVDLEERPDDFEAERLHQIVPIAAEVSRRTGEPPVTDAEEILTRHSRS
ncbi:hypothetical protein [Streptomyces boncukensis]|uniref:Uncharacterized protein n=1 Tax=Streptomyces boncukensis TaxID=2711219 RepID=A0A6G4X1I8_9ACTN|nr:hypothetical protein [Streptomyces boncukensis]NGO70750.1 hypothetical protein [Streptomyces boncukensis]